jgi:putative membrane protein
MTPHDLWHHWDASGAELSLIGLPTLWYAVGLRALWRRAGRGHGVSTIQAVSFESGMLIVALTLTSPLDALADALFSAHMVQHLLLILVAAPLIVLGAPVLPMLWALPDVRRRALGRWWVRRAALRQLVHVITDPGLAFALHLTALWFWHFPVPYQAALRDPPLHAVEHLSFFGTALLFWWAVASPAGRRRTNEGTGILLVAGTLMQSGVLGAVLMFARTPWYPAHAFGARQWGMTLLEDQQLAGLIMWIPASAVYVGAAAWLFLCWMRRDERAVLARQRASTVPRAVPRYEEAS